MTDMSGTGEEIARIRLPGFGTLSIQDDGDPDDYVKTRVRDRPERFDTVSAQASFQTYCRNIRERHGDDVLAEVFESAEPRTSNRASQSKTAELLSQPPSFKCADCGRTFARRRKANPFDDDPDVCDECDDGGDGS